jgi:lipopolysaccharide biosynthesis glycosyltransferase
MMDQAGLNVVLYKKWKAIDTRWNYPPHISDLNDPPYVIHFNGRKPIFYDYNGKHQDLFFKYLHMTEWKNTGTYGFIRKAFIKLPILLPLYFKKLIKRLSR